MSADFDTDFLRVLLKAIFQKAELKRASTMSSLRELNAAKLKFAKAIYTERAGTDKERQAKLRAVVIDIGKAKKWYFCSIGANYETNSDEKKVEELKKQWRNSSPL